MEEERGGFGGSRHISPCSLPHPDPRDQKRRRDPLIRVSGPALFSRAKLGDVLAPRLGTCLSLKALLP